MAFPVITKALQEAYEQGTKGSQDKTPEIIGELVKALQKELNRLQAILDNMQRIGRSEWEYTNLEGKISGLRVALAMAKDFDE